MRFVSSRAFIGACVALWVAPPSARNSPVPVRSLGRIVATSKDVLGAISSVRPLSDGRVLVDDRVGRRVVLFDSSLAHFTPVADTTSETAKAYGAAGGALFAYFGDSSLFADITSLSMLVIDPAGKIVRVIAAPRGNGNGLAYVRGPAYGTVFDGRGNILSKWAFSSPPPLGNSGAPQGPPPPDSAQVQRANIATKKIDTVARLLAPTNNRLIQTAGANGTMSFSMFRNPLPVSDAWAVMGDGTVAVIRELDYHVDWYSPDGKRTSSPKIEHQWEHVTDSMKVAIVDSAKRADSIAAVISRARSDSMTAARGAIGGRVGGGGGGGGGGDFVFFSPVQGAGLAGGGGAGSPIAASGPVSISVTSGYVDPDELPDYLPPFTTTDTLGLGQGVGVAKADADGNIWIRANQAKPLPGGAVFDVVNREGKLVDRVQIPGGTTLVGFGPGVVYLSSRVGSGSQLARAKIH